MHFPLVVGGAMSLGAQEVYVKGLRSKDHQRVAFVLSGGGSIGSIQVGMVHALYERGIRPDFIVASSAGALNGAFLASRPTTVATAQQLGRIWSQLRIRDVFPFHIGVEGLLGIAGRRNHLASSAGLRRLAARWTEFDTLEAAPIPLHIVATDLLSGAEVLLSRGPTVPAVLASSAIPGVFGPVEIEGRQLVDGGVTDNTPVAQAVDLGASQIYVLPTGYACGLQTSPGGALGVAMHAVTLMIQQQMVRDIRVVPEHIGLTVLPPPCPLAVAPTDFSQAAGLIERTLTQSREFLDHLDVHELHAVPTPMRTAVHSHVFYAPSAMSVAQS